MHARTEEVAEYYNSSGLCEPAGADARCFEFPAHPRGRRPYKIDPVAGVTLPTMTVLLLIAPRSTHETWITAPDLDTAANVRSLLGDRADEVHRRDSTMSWRAMWGLG